MLGSHVLAYVTVLSFTILAPLYFMYSCVYYSCFIEETLSLYAAIKAGAEDVAGITRERYLQRLRWLREICRIGSLDLFDERKKSSFARISQVIENLRLDTADGRIRPQPFCVLLFGKPGTGKTGNAMKLAEACLKARYGKFRASDVVVLNEGDEFHSEFRSNHKVVIFDDIAADLCGRDTTNPFRKIIDFVNNIKKTALNPNLELKGNVYIKPELVIITTNMEPGMGIQNYLNCPSAIIRRISAAFKVEGFNQLLFCAKTHTSPGMTTYNAFTTNQRFALTNKGLFEDKFEEDPDFVHGEVKTLREIVKPLGRRFQDHMQKQEDFVNQINSMFDDEIGKDSVISCFYNDVIKPFLPRTIPLSSDEEMRLPFYVRFARRFCIKDLPRAQTMSPQAGEIVPPGQLDDSSEFFLYQNFDPKTFLMCYPLLRSEHKYWITSFGFLSETDDPIVAPSLIHLSPKDPKTARSGPVFSLRQLEDEYERWYFSTQLEETQDSLDVLQFVECPESSVCSEASEVTKPEYIEAAVSRLKPDLFHSFNYGDEIVVQRKKLAGKVYNKVLTNCQRKIPEMGGIGNLKDEPSALLNYTILRRAWHANAQVLGVEYPLCGLTVDGAFRCRGYLVIVEAKTNQVDTKQLRRYLSVAGVSEPVAGIFANYNRYLVYKLGDVSDEAMSEICRIANAAYRFLNKHGKHLQLGLPKNKWQHHDKEYIPPSCWYN